MLFIEERSTSIERNALVVATHLNNAQSVDKLLKRGVNPNIVAKGCFLLHTAIRNDNKEIVSLLLKAGADPNFQEESTGYKAILIASSEGKLEALKVLIEFGVSINLNLHSGYNLLHATIINDSYHTAEYLIKLGLNFVKFDGSNDFLLFHLAKTKHPNVLKLVLDNGANVFEAIGDFPENIDYHPQFNSRLSRGDYAVVISVITSRPENLELFLIYGFTPNARIFNGTSTLLHVACELNDVRSAKILI